MLIAFELTMPNRGSWNGKWSGEDRHWIIVRDMGRGKQNDAKAEAILDKGDWRFAWGDGWTAAVHATQVSSETAAKLRRKSAGFQGYDWMVRSIVAHNEIRQDVR